jgi:hypothetical protein
MGSSEGTYTPILPLVVIICKISQLQEILMTYYYGIRIFDHDKKIKTQDFKRAEYVVQA